MADSAEQRASGQSGELHCLVNADPQWWISEGLGQKQYMSNTYECSVSHIVMGAMHVI